MGLIMQLIVGGIVGWLASIVMKTNAQMGIIANIVVGIVGSAIGGWIASLLGIAGGTVVQWLVSIAGAVIFIAILKKFGFFK
ncbi:MAG: GlsB/YeaQ/YmgE family stress response membrane protein [Vicinamibacterales bacterium]|nr:GlsB/YeaQ/YmgE family stress response membrane protein [Vicinamibacterales bacterium]